VVSLHEPFPLTVADEPGTNHLGEVRPGRPPLLPLPVLGTFVHQGVDGIAVPHFALPRKREFSDLLVPTADVTEFVRPFRLYAVQVPVLIGKVMLIGRVENRELLIETETR
jgi:hypothetical protein